MMNQFSIELGLTEQQKQQIVPFLKQEVPKLEALKKNTSLSKVQKMEQLKQIGSSIDAKITPLLDPQQQPKYRNVAGGAAASADREDGQGGAREGRGRDQEGLVRGKHLGPGARAACPLWILRG